MSTNTETIGEVFESIRDNLLDLTFRNKLLNFKPYKKSIEIIDESIEELFDILVLQEGQMKFLSNDDMENEIDLDNNLWDKNEKVKAEYQDSYLQTNHDDNDLTRRLKTIYNSNKLSIE